MRLVPIIALMGLLSACVPGDSERSCFALVPYSGETQSQAAVELAALPRDAALVRMIDDYGELRARIRGACGQ